jgi:hypothetical protein
MQMQGQHRLCVAMNQKMLTQLQIRSMMQVQAPPMPPPPPPPPPLDSWTALTAAAAAVAGTAAAPPLFQSAPMPWAIQMQGQIRSMMQVQALRRFQSAPCVAMNLASGKGPVYAISPSQLQMLTAHRKIKQEGGQCAASSLCALHHRPSFQTPIFNQYAV